MSVDDDAALAADDEARRRVRLDLDASLVVEGGAGTGKTTVLAQRVVELVRHGRATVHTIAIVTRTDAAAEVARRDVGTALAHAHADDRGERARLDDARGELGDAAITTLHGIARRILSAHAVAAGIPPRLTVLDAAAERADFDRRFARFADELLASADAEGVLVAAFSLGLAPADLHDLAGALHDSWGRLSDGARAGLHARRPGAWSGADPRPVLDALDSAVALAGLGTGADDVLASHLDDLAAVRARLASCADDQAVLQYLGGRRPLTCAQGQAANWGGRVDDVRAACAAAEAARVGLLRASGATVAAELGARLAAFVLDAAEERRATGRLGRHDVLVHARRVVRDDPAVGRELRARFTHLLIDDLPDDDPVQRDLLRRLARAVGAPAGQRDRRPGAVVVTTDAEQSPRLEGVDGVARSVLGDGGSDVVALHVQHRSVPGLVRFVDAIFAALSTVPATADAVVHHHLVAARAAMPSTRRKPGAAPAPASAGTQLPFGELGEPGDGAPVAGGPGGAGRGTAGRAPGGGAAAGPGIAGPSVGVAPVVVVGGPVRAGPGEVRRAAARGAAAAVGDAVAARWPVLDEPGGVPRPARWRDVAVLVAEGGDVGTLEEALEAGGIPYRLEGAALQWGEDEVRDVLSALRAADDPVDAAAVATALRTPSLACGDDDLVSWHDAGGTWDPRATTPPGLDDHPVARAMAVLARLHEQRWWREPSALVLETFDELHSFEVCLARHRPRERWARLRWLLDQARLFDETIGGPVRAFLEWAERRAAGDGTAGSAWWPPDEDDDAVRVMTVDGAAGQAFPVVVVAGVEPEPVIGRNDPALVWAEGAAAPELRVRGVLRTAGYEDAAAPGRALDEMARRRQLYSSMTRARDHLVLCVHHRERTGGPVSLGAAVHAACEGHRHLWRRLPVDAGVEPGPVEASASAAGAAGAATGSGAPWPASETADPAAVWRALVDATSDEEFDAWRAGVDAFARARADALAPAAADDD